MMSKHDEMGRLSAPVTARDHAQGPADAVVTLVEYGDYQCPHCGRAHPIVQEVQRRLGDRLRFVFRNFPLAELHPQANRAAEAAEAAGSQEQFWPMHHTLFAHQSKLDDAHLRQYAVGVGLDIERFEQDLDTQAHAHRVREDFRSGVRSGVNGTPTFFINGVRHDDEWDVETLADALLRASSAAG